MGYKDYKKNRQALEEKIAKKIEEQEKGGFNRESDPRFWEPTVAKDGNGSATIRFLPNKDGDEVEVPWVCYYSYGFQGPTGKWYIENSPTTFKEPDPVAEYNSMLWNTGDEDLIKDVRMRARREQYISNIVVVDDPANPENNGKLFLYRYNKTIFGKLEDRMKKKKSSLSVFDFEKGCDFEIEIRNKGGYRNYDGSHFGEGGPLFDGDEDKIEEIYNSLYGISEFVSKDRFKDYETLKKQFLMVMGITEDEFEVIPETGLMKKGRRGVSKSSAPKTKFVSRRDEEDEEEEEEEESPPVMAVKKKSKKVEVEEEEVEDDEDEEEDVDTDDDDDDWIKNVTKRV